MSLQALENNSRIKYRNVQNISLEMFIDDFIFSISQLPSTTIQLFNIPSSILINRLKNV